MMTIIFQNDQKNLRDIILPMIEMEWGFDLVYANSLTTILFYKGTWSIRSKKEESVNYVEMNDGPSILECKNPILKGFIEEKIKNAKEYETDTPCRSLPARIILDTMELLCGSVDLIEGIKVYASHRNTYFDKNGNIQVSG